MTYEYAYQIATWICNNAADEALTISKFAKYATAQQIRLIYSCVNRSKDMIDTRRLKRYLQERKA